MKVFSPGFYTNVFGIGFLALILFALVVPTIQSALRPRGKTQFRLTEAEMATLRSEVERGSAASARRIYEHYVYFERDRTNAFQWLERAAVLGDEPAKRSMKGVYDSTGSEGYRSFIGRTNQFLEAIFIQSVPANTKKLEPSGAENPIPSGTSDAKASGVPDSRGL